MKRAPRILYSQSGKMTLQSTSRNTDTSKKLDFKTKYKLK